MNGRIPDYELARQWDEGGRVGPPPWEWWLLHPSVPRQSYFDADGNLVGRAERPRAVTIVKPTALRCAGAR